MIPRIASALDSGHARTSSAQFQHELEVSNTQLTHSRLGPLRFSVQACKSTPISFLSRKTPAAWWSRCGCQHFLWELCTMLKHSVLQRVDAGPSRSSTGGPIRLKQSVRWRGIASPSDCIAAGSQDSSSLCCRCVDASVNEELLLCNRQARLPPSGRVHLDDALADSLVDLLVRLGHHLLHRLELLL